MTAYFTGLIIIFGTRINPDDRLPMPRYVKNKSKKQVSIKDFEDLHPPSPPVVKDKSSFKNDKKNKGKASKQVGMKTAKKTDPAKSTEKIKNGDATGSIESEKVLSKSTSKGFMLGMTSVSQSKSTDVVPSDKPKKNSKEKSIEMKVNSQSSTDNLEDVNGMISFNLILINN